MRAVVDTNVVTYYLLGTEQFADEARGFWAAVTEPVAPAIWEAELANVVWMAIRKHVLPADEGPRRLDLAAGLGVQSIPNRALWQGALTRSVASGITVYDTLFIELASRERLPLATFDGRLLTSFPGIAKRPGEILDPRTTDLP
jgi:predicted nucleic acid-binding protein